MDDRGCPSDPVFPGLEKDNQTGALLGKFEAFKFSDTTVVNFEVNVQFCQEKCNPVSIFFLARCTLAGSSRALELNSVNLNINRIRTF